MNTTTERELSFTREVPLTAAQLYRGWTESDLLVQWFTPKPWSTVKADLDVRAGGTFHTVMRSPEGEEFPGTSVYLEVVPNEKLVWTNAFTQAWQPLELKPGDEHNFLFACILTFEDLGENRARYTARVLHWSEADCRKHEAMGFHDGWGKALDQLVELMSKA